MGKPAYNRSDRLTTTLQKELGTMINGRELREFRDPTFAGLISVTAVVLEGNYQHANVYVSVFEDEHRKNVLAILSRCIPVIRGEICRRFRLRFAPTLAFYADESLERACRVLHKIDELDQDTE